ncbi:MAG TPA: S26 family signal peptidase, partial [Phycisphaerae bacterium]|nr:S26 family signal peptidase [Phycisphaerae bacterium]
SGDRILVLKWAYDLNLFDLGPRRWDVAVFKNPSDGQANYIKRIVGLPGEVLEVIDGNVYAAAIDDLKQKEPGLVEALDALRLQVARQRTASIRPTTGHGGMGYERPDLMAEFERLNKRLLPHLRIQRKTRLAQESLWIEVYNHDYCPPGQPGNRPLSPVRWVPLGQAAEQAWNTSRPEIVFAAESDEPLAIRFEGKPIRDYMAYNFSQMLGRQDDGNNPVGDVRLQFTVIPDGGDGSIRLRINRDLDTFMAEVAMDGTVSLDHLCTDLPGGRQNIGQARLQPFARGQAVSLILANVDYRVALEVDGREVLWTSDQQYRPNLKRGIEISYDGDRLIQPTQVEIAARRLTGRLRHLRLDRDVYYRSLRQDERPAHGPENAYLGWPGWGTAGCPIMLRSDRVVDGKFYFGEYFMLGDNSPASKDSRRWWELGPHLVQLGDEYQLGTVPGDQLIGRAFFVYWPAGYRPSWAANLGLIPNVGRMRWIR